MWNVVFLGEDFYHIINWFFIYSFLGWVWETVYISIRQGQFVNRGFINGPLCTIYGFGAVAVYLILRPLEANTFALYGGGLVVATVLEYFTALLMESIFHTTWWDYSKDKFNFQGRICLRASLGWGGFTVLLFRVLHPMVEELVELYPRVVGQWSVCVFGIVYIFDFSTSAAAALHLRERIPVWEADVEKRRKELILEANEKMEEWGRAHGVSVSDMKSRIENLELFDAFEEKRKSLIEETRRELLKYRHSITSGAERSARRFVKAYPNLDRGYRLRHNKAEKRERE